MLNNKLTTSLSGKQETSTTGGPAKALDLGGPGSGAFAGPPAEQKHSATFKMLLIQEARQRPLLGLCWTSRSTSSRLTTIQIHRMDVKNIFILYYMVLWWSKNTVRQFEDWNSKSLKTFIN